jgi:hypothetical protein
MKRLVFLLSCISFGTALAQQAAPESTTDVQSHNTTEHQLDYDTKKLCVYGNKVYGPGSLISMSGQMVTCDEENGFDGGFKGYHWVTRR